MSAAFYASGGALISSQAELWDVSGVFMVVMCLDFPCAVRDRASRRIPEWRERVCWYARNAISEPLVHGIQCGKFL